VCSSDLLTIEAKDANHQNMLIADIQTTLDMKNIRGDINLFFNTITDPSNSITLTKKQPLHAIYTLSKGHDSLWLSPSSWQFMGNDFHIEQTDLEIIFENLSSKFEKVKVLFPNKAYLEIFGEGSLKEKSLQSTIHIFNPSFFGITSAQKYIPIRLSYNNDTLTLATQRDTLFNYDNQKIWLKKTKLLFKDNILSLPKTLIKFDRFLEVNLQGNYNVSKDMGEIQTQDLVLKDSDKNPLLKVDRPLKISLIKNNNNFIATQKDLQLFTNFTNQGWSLEAKKLENIFSLSPFLYDYNLTNGFFSVTQQYTKSQIDFSLQTNYPYKLLHDTNKHIENYNIVGSYQTKNQITKIDINEKLSLIYDKKINLHAKDIGIDIFTLFNFIEEKMPKKETNTPIDIFFSAENSYLYLNKERRIIADTMELEFSKDGIDASLRHQNGEAHLNYDEKKQFILYGQGFSDTFLEQLFSYSKFQNANLGFTLNGTIDDFKGVLYLKDSTIKDYKIINNILAFVNTIPSLVTFSLPGYNNKGLFVTKGYVKFHAKDFLFDISDILLESKEISILGKGKIDYKKDSVDLELNLKTDLGSSVSKIPIIGYIFLDKQNIGTTLKVEGTLQDPSVSSLLAREIIVAPFSIIKRTFLLPYHLFTDDEE
ncbi:MAG: AsmA-like C-terminal domain-containing protein, partial [Sulfurimonadaceae bacterium]|jgi:hypothetical protein|nr:AsmA-like C-terminal domain-containing protein [Sulfurimonadaceae bacterium]